jgi:hypothetical protein
MTDWRRPSLHLTPPKGPPMEPFAPWARSMGPAERPPGTPEGPTPLVADCRPADPVTDSGGRCRDCNGLLRGYRAVRKGCVAVPLPRFANGLAYPLGWPPQASIPCDPVVGQRSKYRLKVLSSISTTGTARRTLLSRPELHQKLEGTSRSLHRGGAVSLQT